jgi:hypothetical protein
VFGLTDAQQSGEEAGDAAHREEERSAGVARPLKIADRSMWLFKRIRLARHPFQPLLRYKRFERHERRDGQQKVTQNPSQRLMGHQKRS